MEEATLLSFLYINIRVVIPWYTIDYMKKIIASLFALIFSVSYVSASTCVDLSSSVVRFQENPKVRTLQNFLYEKGYLKATPNGYYGLGTFLAVKAFQKAEGLEQVGNVGPSTRRALKVASCGGVSTNQTQPSQSTPQVTTTTQMVVIQKPIVKTVPKTPTDFRNLQRREDIDKLLKTLYMYYADSRGVSAASVSNTPVELCFVPKTILPIQQASTTEVAVITTPISPCVNYADITFLIPNYIDVIPHDPLVATGTPTIGYTILRSGSNDVTLDVKTPENKAVIRATCNFNEGCTKITDISSEPVLSPVVASSSRYSLIRDSWPKDDLTLHGKGFTATNTISITEKYTRKMYTLGTFTSTDGYNLPIRASSTNQTFSCGSYCEEKIPLGDYSLTVTNEGGSSNPIYISFKGYTGSSFSARSNTSVTPKTKDVKLGSISISTGIPVTIKYFTVDATATTLILPSKVNHYVFKDPSSGTVYTGGGLVVSLPDQTLYENQSKIFDLYAGIDEVLTNEGGVMTLGGKFTVIDSFTKSEMDLPIKPFSFTVSY